MKLTPRACLQSVVALLCLAAGTASAHPLHGISLFDGLSHPMAGLDHVLAMTAVGAWAQQQGGRWRWTLPAGFVAAMALGALWAANGLLRQVPATMVESFVAASVLVLGVLLAARARFQWGGVAVVAVFALFHGAAHVADVQAGTTLSAYAAGFLVATVALHAAGFFTGAALARAGSLRWAGAGVAVAGLWMLQAAT